MTLLANCPGCGFRGRLPAALTGIKTIVCPNCTAAVPLEQVRQQSAPTADGMFPIWVDGVPQSRIEATDSPSETTTLSARGDAPTVAARPDASPAVESELVPGDYMKDEAARFAQYVAARLGELKRRRMELAEAECRFETLTMERKQELFRTHGVVAAETERLKERAAAVAALEAAAKARDAEFAARAAELTTREARVARAESRAADTDRRTAELRAAIDQLDATRAALAEERADLARRAEALATRAEALDRAELAMHRRLAELDEITS
jgi:hypothetical protein